MMVSEYRVFNCIADRLKDNIGVSLSAHRKKTILVVFLKHGLVLAPGLESLSDEIFGVAGEPLQSLALSGELRWVDLQVEEFTGHWVDSALLEPVDGAVERLVEHAGEARGDAHALEQIDL